MDAYEFSKKVESRIEDLSKEEYLLKNSDDSKRLLEELLPISKLALALKQPGLEIDVEGYEGYDEADGLIIESGFRSRRLPIQVTCDYSYEEALRDEQIFKQGHTSGNGPIKRDKKTNEIESILVAVNSNEYIKKASNSIITLFNKKCQKNYTTKMVLIISFFEFKLSGLHNWSDLLKEISINQDLHSECFINTYLFNSASNEIYKVA